MERTEAPSEPVLIVDDDAASAKLLSVLLQAEGYRTRVADSAEQALAMLQTLVPCAIVVDLVLPLMSGLLFTQCIKADARTRDIPVIAVTAVSGGDLERLALEAGCRSFVRKPIDPGSFTELLPAHKGDHS
jgi:CheY-like chemotaxis protein